MREAIGAGRAGTAGRRVLALDLARGAAIVAMVIYHFAWDLTNAGVIAIDVGVDPAWRWFAHIIAATFLALVGVGLVLSIRDGFRRRSFLKRLAFIVAGALGVTLVTWIVFPDEFVYFGILHAIAVMSVLALPFLWLPIWAALVGAVVSLAAPYFLTGSAFDSPFLWWLGLSASPPGSVDFVPVFPWFAAALVGIAAARLALQAKPLAFWAVPQFAARPWRALVLMGQWSLVIYLVHQPVLFTIANLASRVLPDRTDRVALFRSDCQRSCEPSGRGPTVCAGYCGCLVDRLGENDLLAHALANTFTPEESDRWMQIIALCRPIGTVVPPAP